MQRRSIILCRRSVILEKKDSCPLKGKYLSESIIYKATVKEFAGNQARFYVGLTVHGQAI